jgi:hypothetical protein
VMLSLSAKLRINSAKHLAFSVTCEDEILRLSPLDDSCDRASEAGEETKTRVTRGSN